MLEPSRTTRWPSTRRKGIWKAFWHRRAFAFQVAPEMSRPFDAMAAPRRKPDASNEPGAENCQRWPEE
eukprot:9272738-Pyramimonas_sp.AAC.1